MGLLVEIPLEDSPEYGRSSHTKYLGEAYSRQCVQRKQQTGGENKFVLCQQQNVTELEEIN